MNNFRSIPTVNQQKENQMHYKNGRPAQNGDKVVWIDAYGGPVTGILYDATAGNDYCNGKLAPISSNNPCPNLKECLRADDVKAATELLPPFQAES